MNDPRETLNRIRNQADNATEGPWRHISIFEVGGFVEDPHGRDIFDWAQDDAGTICAPDPDAAFIAATRTTVPARLDLADAVLKRHVEGRTFYGHGFSQRMCECGASWPCPDYTAATTALEKIA